MPDVADDVVLAESVSLALMVVLESLGPKERAVFLLREVFGYEHAEIAEALGMTAVAVRQTAHRAKQHVESRRPRFEADDQLAGEVRERFTAAVVSGDVQGLMDLMAPDVVVLSDGGGKVRAARRPVEGADAAARLLVGIAHKAAPGLRLEDRHDQRRTGLAGVGRRAARGGAAAGDRRRPDRPGADHDEPGQARRAGGAARDRPVTSGRGLGQGTMGRCPKVTLCTCSRGVSTCSTDAR